MLSKALKSTPSLYGSFLAYNVVAKHRKVEQYCDSSAKPQHDIQGE
jgi:hypothetical protein